MDETLFDVGMLLWILGGGDGFVPMARGMAPMLLNGL
jgi:hypothetical protein